jgi:hypothetical protein
MSLFWLCFETAKGVCVVLQPANYLLDARLKASIAGLTPGEFREGHALDAKLIRRIPKQYIGKCLTRTQAARLLTSIEKGRKRA